MVRDGPNGAAGRRNLSGPVAQIPVHVSAAVRAFFGADQCARANRIGRRAGAGQRGRLDLFDHFFRPPGDWQMARRGRASLRGAESHHGRARLGKFSFGTTEPGAARAHARRLHRASTPISLARRRAGRDRGGDKSVPGNHDRLFDLPPVLDRHGIPGLDADDFSDFAAAVSRIRPGEAGPGTLVERHALQVRRDRHRPTTWAQLLMEKPGDLGRG